LAARLGQVDRAWLADLRGDAPVLGCDRRFDDTDVPEAVVAARGRAGQPLTRHAVPVAAEYFAVPGRTLGTSRVWPTRWS
jgi:hypothetical protein